MPVPQIGRNSLRELYDRVEALEALFVAGDVNSVFGRTGVVTAQTDDYTWAQINKAVSSLADITTRSASDLNSGTLPDARLSANVYTTTEQVDDRVAALIQNGTGITWTYDDGAATLTGNVSITQYTDELAQDAVGGILTNTATLSWDYDDMGNTISADVIQSGIDHGSVGGLSDDDHAQYALLAGRVGNQVLTGGTASGGNLYLTSTSHATKGSILALNSGDKLGIGGVTTPTSGLFATFSDVAAPTRTGTTKGIMVAGATDTGFTAKNTATGAEMIFGGFFTGGQAIGTISATNVAFIRGGTERMTLTSTGLGIDINLPTSGIDLRNSMSWKQTVDSTTSYTALDTDFIILMTNVAGRTVNLPAASTRTGRVYVIVDGAGTATTAPISVDPNGAELINGMSAFNVDKNGASALIYCDGTGWKVIASPGTFGGGTVTSVTAGSGLTGGTITGSGTIAVDTGAVVQRVFASASEVATGTTVIPIDDTIPQKTEGDEYITLAITPKATTNRLLIQALVFMSHSAASCWQVAALFQDATSDALAVGEMFEAVATAPNVVPVTYEMAAGTTSATTFRIRAGGHQVGTTTFNGQSGARRFGAIVKSSIVITEVKA